MRWKSAGNFRNEPLRHLRCSSLDSIFQWRCLERPLRPHLVNLLQLSVELALPSTGQLLVSFVGGLKALFDRFHLIFEFLPLLFECSEDRQHFLRFALHAEVVDGLPDHGEDRVENFNVMRALIEVALDLGILYWGGFFRLRRFSHAD